MNGLVIFFAFRAEVFLRLDSPDLRELGDSELRLIRSKPARGGVEEERLSITGATGEALFFSPIRVKKRE